MKLESINGPEDFQVGRVIVAKRAIIETTRYWEEYEIVGPSINGRMKFEANSYEGADRKLVSRNSYEFRVPFDFGNLSNWGYYIKELKYDPNQQGDTDEDI